MIKHLATAGILVAAALSIPGAAAGHPPAPAAAHVWITTPDGTDKMADLGTDAFGDGPTTAPTVVVDPGRTFQTMAGFGASITDSSASVLYTLNPAARAAAMTDLFSPTRGDGLDYLRQPIGASDF